MHSKRNRISHRHFRKNVTSISGQKSEESSKTHGNNDKKRKK